MTKKTYYEKVGDEFVPVAEYGSDFMDSYPKGTHLVVCKPGSTSRKFNIEADFAAMIVAGEYAKDAICTNLLEASELKPERKPITLEQKAAWNNLKRAFGNEMYTLQGVAPADIAQAAVDEMKWQFTEAYANPSVRKAYNNLMTLIALTKEHK